MKKSHCLVRYGLLATAICLFIIIISCSNQRGSAQQTHQAFLPLLLGGAGSQGHLTPLNTVAHLNKPSELTAIIGYSFYPGDDLSQPVSEYLLQKARNQVIQAANEGALWLDADMGISNYLESFTNDPALTFYPLAAAILDEAHQRGVKVFFYFSATEIETLQYSQVPENQRVENLFPGWLQIDQNGQPLAFAPGEYDAFWLEADTGDARMTPLSADFKAEIFTRALVLAELGADGLFFDVPYFFTEVDERWGDFSNHAAAAFMADTGLALPYNLEDDGTTWHRWVEWRHRVWQEFFMDLRNQVQLVNPETVIIVEEYPGADPAGVIATGLDSSYLEGAAHIIAHEYGYKQDDGGAIAYDYADWVHTRDVYKWYQGMNQHNWSLCYATAPADSRVLAGISFAHQQSFWETKAPTMVDETTGQTWRAELLAWTATHQAVLSGADPAANVAVLLANRTRDLTWGDSMADLEEIQHLLDGQNIPYVILTERNIADIHAFPYLILPNVVYADEAVLTEIQAYAGTLISTADTFTWDAWGEVPITPPLTNLPVNQVLAQIGTTPIAVESDLPVFVELFRVGDAVQIRLFNPNYAFGFEPLPQQVTLAFTWQGDAPVAEILHFMTESAVPLTINHVDGTHVLTVPLEIFAVITIE